MGMMMDMGQPQQQPAGGMLSGMQGGNDPNTSHGKFNGVVETESGPVEVRAGVAQVDGEPYMVSDTGALVVNTKGQLVGHIENGKFVVVTPEYHQQMTEAGYLQ